MGYQKIIEQMSVPNNQVLFICEAHTCFMVHQNKIFTLLFEAGIGSIKLRKFGSQCIIAQNGAKLIFYSYYSDLNFNSQMQEIAQKVRCAEFGYIALQASVKNLKSLIGSEVIDILRTRLRLVLPEQSQQASFEIDSFTYANDDMQQELEKREQAKIIFKNN